MKKLARFAATTSILVGLSGGLAAAATSNTGPGSTNTTTNTSSNSTVCINNNVIDVSNSNNQSASSGSSSNKSNTSGGSAQSGSASNSNSSNVTVSTNGSCPKGTTAVPANSPAAQAAAAGQTNLVIGKGGALLSSSTAGLPETGAADTVKTAVLVTAGLAGAAAVSQLGLGIYRRRVLSN